MEPIERFNMDSGIGGISDDPLFQRVWRRRRERVKPERGNGRINCGFIGRRAAEPGAFPEEIRVTRALSGLEASEEMVGMIREAIRVRGFRRQITRRLVRGAPWGAAEALSTIAADELRLQTTVGRLVSSDRYPLSSKTGLRHAGFLPVGRSSLTV
jgi:hypothetical protein